MARGVVSPVLGRPFNLIPLLLRLISRRLCRYNTTLAGISWHAIGSGNRNGRSGETIRFALTQKAPRQQQEQLQLSRWVVPLAL